MVLDHSFFETPGREAHIARGIRYFRTPLCFQTMHQLYSSEYSLTIWQPYLEFLCFIPCCIAYMTQRENEQKWAATLSPICSTISLCRWVGFVPSAPTYRCQPFLLKLNNDPPRRYIYKAASRGLLVVGEAIILGEVTNWISTCIFR